MADCRYLHLLIATVLPVLASCTTGTSTISEAGVQIERQHYAHEPYPVRFVDRRKFAVIFRPAIVVAPAGYAPGTIVIDTDARLLYLVGTEGKARRYGIAVGASGQAWSGKAAVGRKAEWPAWYPTDDMHAQTPQLPRRIEPGPQNPLGARALYLYQNGVDTLYRIHGTSEPWSIGTKASSGCIRMVNEDIIDLYNHVTVGTSVVVTARPWNTQPS